MSFSISVPATELDGLPERLDGLQPSPPLQSEEAQAAFDTAKAAFEQIATTIAKNDKPITGTISGHWYEDDGLSWPKNNISVSVSETEPLPVAAPVEDAADAAADEAVS